MGHFLFSRTDPFFRLNEEHLTFHLQYKHFGTFANRKCEELCNPKKSENMRHHFGLLKKIRPHCSQSSRENATPSSDTSPLASYKELRPLPKGSRFQISLFWTACFCFPTKMLHLNARLFPLKCSVSPKNVTELIDDDYHVEAILSILMNTNQPTKNLNSNVYKLMLFIERLF